MVIAALLVFAALLAAWIVAPPELGDVPERAAGEPEPLAQVA
ncbi:MAG TPA: hypothetical protein VHK06_06620 [Candidatus Limnocylindria bacterium]|jgi:hypothetical protein|nr:hypothetical protein [Candidatus Limnocylindria bacterium]